MYIRLDTVLPTGDYVKTKSDVGRVDIRKANIINTAITLQLLAID